MPDSTPLIVAILGLPLAFCAWYASLDIRTTKAQRIRWALLIFLSSIAVALSVWIFYTLSVVASCIEWFVLSSC